MNLFTEYNFVLRGGGLFLMDDPVIDLEHITLADCSNDFGIFAQSWATTASPPSHNWNEECDLAPVGSPDGKIDMADLAVFASHWLDGV